MTTIRFALAVATLLAGSTDAVALEGVGYEYQLACGQPSDQPVSTERAAMLIGGAEANTAGESAATAWFLEQGGGGDYLVLRTGGTGSQAAWLCSAFNGEVSSAAELSVDTRAAATDAQVLARVGEAEMLFIAGGDQRDYVELWRDTPLAAAINAHVLEAPVAGTSAGMAILGESYYAPVSLGILSSEILDDPLDPLSDEIGHGDFIEHPLLSGTITDTHLDRTHGAGNEFRYGRLFGLLARLVQTDPVPGRELAIGAEEAVFIAASADGNVQVFGPESSAAWFLWSDRLGPEQLQAGQLLVWDRGEAAVKAYRLPASPTGMSGLDLNDPTSASGGVWHDWFTDGGWAGFNFANGSCSDCSDAEPPRPDLIHADAFRLMAP
jgi:cyanophycinase-like exopeptidase